MAVRSLGLFLVQTLCAATVTAQTIALVPIPEEFSAPRITDLPPPPVVIAAPAPAGAPQIFVPELWDSLQPPDAATLAFLASQIPGLDPAKVRQITPEAERILLARAVELHLSSLDLFTDPGLIGDRVYYIPQPVIVDAVNGFEIRSLFPFFGTARKDKKDVPFTMNHLVLGRSRVDMLYSVGDFTYNHPIYRSHGGKFKFEYHPVMEIAAPGHALVHGVKLLMGFPLGDLRIQEFVKFMKDVNGKPQPWLRVVDSVQDDESQLFEITAKTK